MLTKGMDGRVYKQKIWTFHVQTIVILGKTLFQSPRIQQKLHEFSTIPSIIFYKKISNQRLLCMFLQANYHSLKGEMCFMSQKNRRPFQAMALMSGILSSLVGSILVGIFSGRALDKWVGTEPLFLIIGLMLGLAAGIYAMLRLINQFFSGDN